MTGFILQTAAISIRFRYYNAAAPATCAAFHALLPFTKTFLHARVSGREIWIDDAPPLNIPQENASIHTLPGEVVYGPQQPARVKTANCMGIYYGEGKGLDACNIFARVFEEDQQLLEALGNDIWMKGAQALTFEPLNG